MSFRGVDLAHKWRPEKDDVVGWWMSEKLDGVRAYWDGENFLSRTGKLFHVPAWFKDGLPTGIPLDGELYIDRGKFQETISIVRNHREDEEEWSRISYAVFDAPHVPGGWEQRMLVAQEQLTDHPHAICVEQVQVESAEHVMRAFGGIRAQGGEGVMLRKPGSMPAFKRTRNLLKVKGVIDGLAVVHSIIPGMGKHHGRMGALHVFPVVADNGGFNQTGDPAFNVGTGFSDAERELEWMPGIVIRWEAHEYTRDRVPRHPRFLATWEGD
jgi:DNA ligase-1